MKTSLGGRVRTTAAAAFCLLLPLWLGSCVSVPESPGGTAAEKAPAAAPGPAAPDPRPVPAPTPPEGAGAATPPAATAGEGLVQGSGAGPGIGSGAGSNPNSGTNSVPQAAATPPPPAPPAESESVDGTAGGPALPEQDVAGAPAPSAAGTGTGGAAAGPAAGFGTGAASGSGGGSGIVAGTAVYYVAVDDGGSSGVRFGCNDSLVAVRHADPAIREPLQAAMGHLLSGSGTPAGLYNALASSALKYVSGYLDGETVVVNLTGAVQPGGVCDIPRIDAQLTHTAVTAVGAVRAEIYVDGVRLADVLSLR